MASSQLVTCGENVRVWDLSDYTLLYEFNHPTAKTFCSLSWNYENQFLSVPAEQQQFIISDMLENDVHNKTFDVGMKVTSACFSQKTPRYVSVGTATGEILSWDTYQERAVKTIAETSSGITCLHHNPVDSHVASGCLNGNIFVHNISSGVSCAPFITGNSSNVAVRSLQYSSHNKSLLGSTCDGGHVELWDVNQQRLYARLQEKHLAPSLDLKFSPLSNLVVASVGLDKRILVHDMKQKKIVHDIRCEVPLRSLDFLPEGITIVVAGSKGLVCVYDLRQTSRTVATFSAHSMAVQKVAVNLPRNNKYDKPRTRNILKPTTKLEVNHNHRPFCSSSSGSSASDTHITEMSDSDFPVITPMTNAMEDFSNIPDLRKHVLMKRKSTSPSNNVQKTSLLKADSSSKSTKAPIHKESFAEKEEKVCEDSTKTLETGETNHRVGNKENLGSIDVVSMDEAESNERLTAPLVQPPPLEQTVSHPFQVQGLREIVADVVEDLRETLHMDNMNLFMQMFKQFTILQSQVEHLHVQCQTNTELLQEVQQLREENRRLKSSY